MSLLTYVTYMWSIYRHKEECPTFSSDSLAKAPFPPRCDALISEHLRDDLGQMSIL